jgi:hypothetical protein
MSGLLALIYLAILIGVPVIAVSWAWRRWTKAFQRGIAVFGGFLGMLGMLWLALGDQWAADKQVRELCAKDGGVRVYETVTLPTDKYDMYARANWVIPDKSHAKLTDDYYSETDRHYFKTGNPEMSRRQYQIVRRSDGKILGESISYGRGGGDLPGPWHESSYHCPSGESLSIETQIFQRGSK